MSKNGEKRGTFGGGEEKEEEKGRVEKELGARVKECESFKSI